MDTSGVTQGGHQINSNIAFWIVLISLCVRTDMTAVCEHLALTNDLPSIYPDTAHNIPSITLYGHFQEEEGAAGGGGKCHSQQ